MIQNTAILATGTAVDTDSWNPSPKDMRIYTYIYIHVQSMCNLFLGTMDIRY